MDTALRALNRFGLGARVGDRKRIGDPRTWLRRQLAGGAPFQQSAVYEFTYTAKDPVVSGIGLAA